MEVEVSIQDCFWSSFERSPQNDGTEVIFPIATDIWERWFVQWLSIVEAELPRADSYELGLRLTGDEEMQRLNLQYRQQNKPTDVLAFAALEVDRGLRRRQAVPAGLRVPGRNAGDPHRQR